MKGVSQAFRRIGEQPTDERVAKGAPRSRRRLGNEAADEQVMKAAPKGLGRLGESSAGEPIANGAHALRRSARAHRGVEVANRAFLALLAIALLGGCAFDARYDGGHYTCSDGKCPSGLVCSASKVCVANTDGGIAIDSAIDSATDAPLDALTCAAPGPIVAGSFAGSTASRVNTVSSSCGGFIMNGPDAVYRITATSGQAITVSITGAYPVNAYAIMPCTVTPGTPLCEGNKFASSGMPITLTLTVGPHYIVVDSPNPAQSGSYTLTVN
jgi:hypothetical protein